MEKVLITGGAGFIGYHLIRRLSQDNARRIHVVDNLSRGKLDYEFNALLANPNIKFIEADLTDHASFNALEADYDYIYNLAAVVGVKNVTDNPGHVLRVNIFSILNLLEWVKNANKNLKKLVYASTSEVYAGTARHYDINIPTGEEVKLTVEDISSSRATYALSKIVGESACFSYHHKHKIPFVILRYHNIYGPRMGFAHVMPETFLKINKAAVVDVPSPGHMRAFCFVDDAVEFTIRACEYDSINKEILHIGNPSEEIRVKDLVAMISRAMDKKVVIKELADTPGSPLRRCPDTQKAEKMTGYKAEIHLEEGIKRSYEWYKEAESENRVRCSECR